jgi:hypothetical protein
LSFKILAVVSSCAIPWREKQQQINNNVNLFFIYEQWQNNGIVVLPAKKAR